MSTTAKKLIENYNKLVDDTYNKKVTSDTLKNLFINANHAQLPAYDFGTNTKVYLHLGWDKTNLFAIISDDKSGDSINTVSKVFISSDLKIEKDPITKKSANVISKDEYEIRKKAWAAGKKTWIEDAIKKENVVRHFIIDKQNISKTVINNLVLGLAKFTAEELDLLTKTVDNFNSIDRIDLMTVNEAYMDYVAPCPPFKY